MRQRPKRRSTLPTHVNPEATRGEDAGETSLWVWSVTCPGGLTAYSGTDRPVEDHIYPTYYRFLETDDEYFPYGTEDIPRQGRWRIYGMYLPDDVLEKVYYKNAERVILGKTGA